MYLYFDLCSQRLSLECLQYLKYKGRIYLKRKEYRLLTSVKSELNRIDSNFCCGKKIMISPRSVPAINLFSENCHTPIENFS